MKNRILKPIIAGSCALLLVTVLGGCSSCKPGQPGPVGKYDIEVVLDDSLKSSSVIVDLVGVNPSAMPRWMAYDMAKYWKAEDPMRHDAEKVVLTFVSGQATNKTMLVTDPLWAKWKAQGVSQVLVLADLPGVQVSKPGTEDARRQVLSLDKCSWASGSKQLRVQVQRSGIVVLTPGRR
jgi:hypothetical protein